MISPDKLFGNMFDDEAIINRRLYTFGLDDLNRMVAANGAGEFTDLINLLTPPLTALGTELGDVDTALNIQLGKTQTVDQVMAAFKLTMGLKKGVIADLLGGAGSPAYLEFYPHGQKEYRQATKTQMPTFVNRIFTAAGAHSAALGATLTSLLQGYKSQWESARTDQGQQFGTVDDNRNERTTARTDTEIALVKVVHSIAAKFPGNVEECIAFFDFSLLFNIVHHQHITFTGVIAPGAVKLVTNQLFTDNKKIRALNPDDNANYEIYLAPTDGAQPSGTGKKVNFGKGIRPKPSQLGALTNSFLLIKNLSDVNEGTYLVEITE